MKKNKPFVNPRATTPTQSLEGIDYNDLAILINSSESGYSIALADSHYARFTLDEFEENNEQVSDNQSNYKGELIVSFPNTSAVNSQKTLTRLINALVEAKIATFKVLMPGVELVAFDDQDELPQAGWLHRGRTVIVPFLTEEEQQATYGVLNRVLMERQQQSCYFPIGSKHLSHNIFISYTLPESVGKMRGVSFHEMQLNAKLKRHRLSVSAPVSIVNIFENAMQECKRGVSPPSHKRNEFIRLAIDDLQQFLSWPVLPFVDKAVKEIKKVLRKKISAINRTKVINMMCCWKCVCSDVYQRLGKLNVVLLALDDSSVFIELLKISEQEAYDVITSTYLGSDGLYENYEKTILLYYLVGLSFYFTAIFKEVDVCAAQQLISRLNELSHSNTGIFNNTQLEKTQRGIGLTPGANTNLANLIFAKILPKQPTGLNSVSDRTVSHLEGTGEQKSLQLVLS